MCWEQIRDIKKTVVIQNYLTWALLVARMKKRSANPVEFLTLLAWNQIHRFLLHAGLHLRLLHQPIQFENCRKCQKDDVNLEICHTSDYTLPKSPKYFEQPSLLREDRVLIRRWTIFEWISGRSGRLRKAMWSQMAWTQADPRLKAAMSNLWTLRFLTMLMRCTGENSAWPYCIAKDAAQFCTCIQQVHYLQYCHETLLGWWSSIHYEVTFHTKE